MEILKYFTDLLASGGVWLVPALMCSMILVQGLKAVVKAWCGFMSHRYRVWLIRVIAFIVGYAIGLESLTGDDVEKWAVVVGLVNPILYFGLVQYAVAKEKMVLLSILKMRPLKKSKNGDLSLDDTQTFFVGKVK